MGADRAVGCDRVQEKKPDVGFEYKVQRKEGKPADTKKRREAGKYKELLILVLC